MNAPDRDTPPPTRPAPEVKALGERFVGLWQRNQLGAIDGSADASWREVAARYVEPHRRYHNLSHLAHCLQQFDLVADRLAQPDQVEAAIWFHDVILVPGRRDNEERSAAYFREAAASRFAEDFVTDVADLILFTTHRSAPADFDHQAICDIDLSSFGSAWEGFLANSTAIEAEFPGTRAEYLGGETAFLETLQKRPRIFLTDFFHARYEERARDNIRRFLALLAKSRAS